ncbi:hypothetical protein KCU87_g293, partial [Aureobasidium melanogenum]
MYVGMIGTHSNFHICSLKHRHPAYWSDFAENGFLRKLKSALLLTCYRSIYTQPLQLARIRWSHPTTAVVNYLHGSMRWSLHPHHECMPIWGPRMFGLSPQLALILCAPRILFARLDAQRLSAFDGSPTTRMNMPQHLTMLIKVFSQYSNPLLRYSSKDTRKAEQQDTLLSCPRSRVRYAFEMELLTRPFSFRLHRTYPLEQPKADPDLPDQSEQQKQLCFSEYSGTRIDLARFSLYFYCPVG